MYEKIDKIIGDVFGKSCDIASAVWEKSKKGIGYNRVYTLHQVSGKNGIILWYKIVIPFKEDKTEIDGSTFYRLWDLDCSYRTIIYNGMDSLKKKLIDLRDEPRFGKVLMSLSKFAETPMELINSALRENGHTWLSVLGVEFSPKWKTTPCSRFNCDFDMFFSSQVNITANIAKTDNDLWTVRFHNTGLDEKITLDNVDELATEIAKWAIENKIG